MHVLKLIYFFFLKGMGRKTHKRNRSIVEEQAELEKEELERKNMEKQAKGNGANASVYTIDLIGEDLKKESTNSFLIVSPTSSSATSPVSPILSKHRRNQSEPVNPYNKPSHLTYPRSEGIPLSSTKRSSPIAEKTYLPDDTLKLDTPTESSEAIHLGFCFQLKLYGNLFNLNKNIYIRRRILYSCS